MEKRLRLVNLLAYLGMIVINFLAIYIPFFGKTPGDVSDIYAHPFTPADFTFKIWSVIYILLGIFIFYQSKNIFSQKESVPEEIKLIGYLFFWTCIFNCIWLFTFQSLNILLSFIAIFVLWVLLIIIDYRLTMFTKIRPIFIIPFSVYLSWVSVATLANLNVLLIDSGFDFFGFSQENWATFLVILGVIGGALVLYLNANYWFLIILAWAYFGVYQKNKDLEHLLPQLTLVSIFIILGMAALSWKIRSKWKIPNQITNIK